MNIDQIKALILDDPKISMSHWLLRQVMASYHTTGIPVPDETKLHDDNIRLVFAALVMEMPQMLDMPTQAPIVVPVSNE